MTEHRGWAFCDRPDCLLCATKSPRRLAEPDPTSPVAGQDPPHAVSPGGPAPAMGAPWHVRFDATPLRPVGEHAAALLDLAALGDRVAAAFDVPVDHLTERPRPRRRFRVCGQTDDRRIGRMAWAAHYDLRRWTVGVFVSRGGVDLHVGPLTLVLMW